MKNEYPLFGKDVKKKKKKKHCQTTVQNNCSFREGTCRNLMPYCQDPNLFLGNHSTVKNIFMYFVKECFGNMKVNFPCLTINHVFITKKFIPQLWSSVGDSKITVLECFLSCNYKLKILSGICGSSFLKVLLKYYGKSSILNLCTKFKC